VTGVIVARDEPWKRWRNRSADHQSALPCASHQPGARAPFVWTAVARHRSPYWRRTM